MRAILPLVLAVGCSDHTLFPRNGLPEAIVASHQDAGAPAADGTSSVALDLAAGPHEITLVATDAEGLTGQACIDIVVNTAPTAPEIAIVPTRATTVEDLHVVVTTESSDPDGDAITYSIAWSVDGTPADTGTTEPASLTERGQEWTVVVTPNDGLVDGPSAAAAVEIDNALPTLSSVVLTPDPATELDVFQCTANGMSDPDGDIVSLSYRWCVDGATLAASAGTLTGSSFSKGQAVQCAAIAIDGVGTSAAVWSSSVVVSNTPPDQPVVEVSPYAPTTDETLTCSVAGFDIDGDPLAYSLSWTVDGVRFAGASTTAVAGDTVAAADTEDGQVWRCTVVGNDGTDDSLPASDQVAIGFTGALGTDVLLYEGNDPNVPRDDDELADVLLAAGATDVTKTDAWPDDLDAYRLLVLVGLPQTSFSSAQTSDLNHYITVGGHLVVLGDAEDWYALYSAGWSFGGPMAFVGVFNDLLSDLGVGIELLGGDYDLSLSTCPSTLTGHAVGTDPLIQDVADPGVYFSSEIDPGPSGVALLTGSGAPSYVIGAVEGNVVVLGDRELMSDLCGLNDDSEQFIVNMYEW